MRQENRFFFPILLLCLCVNSLAQNWSGILAPARAIDWSSAGAGTIPARTTICSTLNPGATVAQINSAITACPANQTVFLSAGNYSLSGQILIIGHSNVTLRGAGSDKTFLVFTGAGTGGVVYVTNNDTNYSGDPHNTANWTAGYAAGATSITLSSITNLNVGSLLILDQLDDASDPGNIYVCQSTSCATEGGSGIGRPGSGSCTSGCRAQMQQVTVTDCRSDHAGSGACDLNTMTISPGLHAPNWRSGQTPGAWWSNDVSEVGVGLEDFSIDMSAVPTTGRGAIIYFQNTSYGWVKGIRSINNLSASAWHKHVWFYQSSHMTVRNSYMYGSAGQQESYGVDSGYGSSDNLIENNICQHVATCEIREGDIGSVFGYNYAVDNFYNGGGGSPDWMMGDGFHHGVGDDFGLWEGNVGSELELDDIHGTSFMLTGFRNYWTGFDPAITNGKSKDAQTSAVAIQAGSRYVNLVGNVLGKTGYHTIYSATAATTSDSAADGNHTIILVGYSGNGGAHGTLNNDTTAVSTLMRWGNYDTVNAGVRFVSGEVPSGISPYGNAVPANQTLPSSFYLNAKPSWWGNSIPWPAIGPDVTGGPGPGGHAYLTPAANCYLNVMGGQTDGSSGALTFNPETCYGPSPPQGLTQVTH